MTASTVTVGGHFSRIGPGQEAGEGVGRAHMATLDPADGTVLGWNLDANRNLGLHTLRLYDDRGPVGRDCARTGGSDQRTW